MKKEKILLFGGNYYPEPTGIGKYNGEMINWLAEQGNSCTVITTFPYYPQWKVQAPYTARSFWFKTEHIKIEGCESVRIIRCPHYVPKKPTSLRRLLSEFSFFFSSCLVVFYLLFEKKFDYVLTVAPPFEMGLLGILYKKIKGAKFLYHIQDLQIDAARDLVMIKSNKMLDFFLSIEKYIIKNADIVSSISKGMIEKIKSKIHKEIILFPNWVDVKDFYPIYNKADLKIKYGFKPTDKVILYSGAIGQKQGLEAILECAKILEHLSNLKFAICGSGPYKENLLKLKEEMNLQNVVFLPLQPFKTFNSFLNMADIHLVLQKKGATDFVLPSKLSTILSVGGVAIVTASKDTSLYNIINSSNMGILIEPENEQELVDAIRNLNEKESEEKSTNARIYAERNLSKDKILSEYFVKVFNYKTGDVRMDSKLIPRTAET